MDTEIVLGLVESIIDPSQSFKIYAKLLGVDDERVNVTYTSPFHFRGKGGVIAVPNVGSKILILYDRTNGNYYYLSTVIEGWNTDDYIQDPSLLLTSITQENYYSDKDIPHRLTFTNEQDAGLVIRDERLTGYSNSEVRLQSDTGKVISLQDSPLDDKIVIRNEHGDGIRVTSDSIGSVSFEGKHHGFLASRSIYLLCDGNQDIVSFTGGIRMMVSEGREIDIENFSTGKMADNTQNGISAGSNKRCGNINIKSYDSDVNIRAGLDASSNSAIFITTPKGRIQINYDGSIDIRSNGDLNIKSLGNITMEATEDIKLKCKNLTVNSSEDSAIVAGGTFLAKSSQTNSLEGSEVHFNSAGIVPAPTSITAITAAPINAYEE